MWGHLSSQGLFEHLRALDQLERLVEAIRCFGRNALQIALGGLQLFPPIDQRLLVRTLKIRLGVQRDLDEPACHCAD
mgnify:CR=1 FL=1